MLSFLFGFQCKEMVDWTLKAQFTVLLKDTFQDKFYENNRLPK